MCAGRSLSKKAPRPVSYGDFVDLPSYKRTIAARRHAAAAPQSRKVSSVGKTKDEGEGPRHAGVSGVFYLANAGSTKK